MSHLIVLTLLLCVWLTTYVSCDDSSRGIGCVESERDALLAFKRGIRVDRCGLLDSWGVTRDCCLWSGIECDNHFGHVINLRLPTPYMCLQGTIGASLLDLKHLKHLDLSFNYFPGQLPKFIGSLTNLNHLNLSNVGLTGVIPQEIGNLSRLTSLDLNSLYYDSNTRVENLGWLAKLTLLREVDLGGTDLSVATGNWLSIVNNLPYLHVLRLDGCNLSLKFDSSLSYTNASKTFGTISLALNNFNDSSIFEWLSKLGGLENNLVYLDLSDNYGLFRDNSLQYKTLKVLGNLCSLQILTLLNTSLNYELSDIIQSLSICSHKSLVSLYLGSNRIWGSIPNNIGNLSYLRELYLYDNQLNDTISQTGLRGLPRLELLSLDSNSLKGVITGAHLSNLSKLKDLDLFSNIELVVNIGANWIPPFQLESLVLSSCKLGPDFPMWLITQKHMTSIQISNAGISDTIPVSFFDSLSSKLEVLDHL